MSIHFPKSLKLHSHKTWDVIKLLICEVKSLKIGKLFNKNDKKNNLRTSKLNKDYHK